MSKAPVVSVCMITYNHEKFIAQAIESVLMQKTNFDFELVIGEDFSIDRTREICISYKRKYPEKINLILNEKNLGMIPNFINTIHQCKGEYIALLEGDDYWTDPYKLQKQVYFLDSNPEYGMVCSDVNLIDNKGNALPDNNMVKKQRELRKPEFTFFDLLECNTVNTLTTCIRADLMKGLAMQAEDEGLWFIFDYWFWLNIAIDHKVKMLFEKTAAYRIHENGLSRQKGVMMSRSAFVKYDTIKRIIAEKRIFSKKENEIIGKNIINLLKNHFLCPKKKLFLCRQYFNNPAFLYYFFKKFIIYFKQNFTKGPNNFDNKTKK